jgi:hypothetical protein
MTSELKPDQYIEEFVSGGRKIYAYLSVGSVVGCRKTVYKLRGITLNYTASQLVNFDLIKKWFSTWTKPLQSFYTPTRKSRGNGRVVGYI